MVMENDASSNVLGYNEMVGGAGCLANVMHAYTSDSSMRSSSGGRYALKIAWSLFFVLPGCFRFIDGRGVSEKTSLRVLASR